MNKERKERKMPGYLKTLNSQEFIALRLEDKTSGVFIVEIKIPLKQLGEICFGCSRDPIEYELFDVADKIGKTRETKPLVFEVSGWRKIDEAKEKAKKLADPGWDVSLYFGSQSSFFKKDDKYYASTFMYRYIGNNED